VAFTDKSQHYTREHQNELPLVLLNPCEEKLAATGSFVTGLNMPSPYTPSYFVAPDVRVQDPKSSLADWHSREGVDVEIYPNQEILGACLASSLARSRCCSANTAKKNKSEDHKCMRNKLQTRQVSFSLIRAREDAKRLVSPTQRELIWDN